MDGSGWSRREEKWKQIVKTANTDNSFRICFDCSFEDVMTSKERGSLGLQLRYVYSVNRKSTHPVYIDVCSLKKGETRSSLEKVAGFPESWVARCFRTHERGLEHVYQLGSDKYSSGNDADCSSSSTYEKDQCKLEEDKSKLKLGAQSSSAKATITASKPKQNLVYLTGDSPNTLTTLCNDTTYIIGGIVDRNRLKRAAINRAEHLSIPTARLPLDEHADFKGSTRILTCNHVFEILLRYRENGGDWKQSIMSVMPGRKDIDEKKDGKEGGDEKNVKIDDTECKVAEDGIERNTEGKGQHDE
jgi:tRNA (guanine9-N1)-methyltransferase